MVFYAKHPEVNSKFYKYMFRFDDNTYRKSVCTVNKVTTIKNSMTKYILSYVEEIDGKDPVKRTCTVNCNLNGKIVITGNFAIVFLTSNNKYTARRFVESYIKDKIECLNSEIDHWNEKLDKLAAL